MVRTAAWQLALFCVVLAAAWADDRSSVENERRWNTPPELTPEQVGKKATVENSGPQARFLPFTASFALSAGQGNAHLTSHSAAHSASVGFGQNGFSVSQSSSLSQAGNPTGNGGSLAASQSSSFAAGLSGISTSDSNSFNLNHPLLGENSQANSNSFALGAASASSHANAGNGQATSGAQSSVESQSVSTGPSSHGVGQASSAAEAATFPAQGQGVPIWTNIGPNYEHDAYHRPSRPTLTVGQRPNGWTRPTHPTTGPIKLDIGEYDPRWHTQHPEIHISKWHPNHGTNHGRGNGGSITITKPGNEASSNKCNNKSPGQPHRGQHRPQTWPQGQHQPQLQNQGRPSLSVHSQGRQPSNVQVNLSQGPSVNSGGLSIGQSSSPNNGGRKTGSYAQSSASSGIISGSISDANLSGGLAHGNRGGHANGKSNGGFVRFPEASHIQSIPREFVRSKDIDVNRSSRSQKKNPVETILTDITDTVADLLDFS